MNGDDIEAGLSLCRSAGWNQVSNDWKLFLRMSAEGCLVATDQYEKVVGTVTTISYEDHFSWIGMVLVDPSMKRQGIGTELLHKAIQILHTAKSIKLDATPAGREVYLKLQFVDEYSLTRMYHKAMPSLPSPVATAGLLDEKDFTSLINLDNNVFGANREEVLKWIWKGAPNLAYVIKDKTKISAFCFGRNGHNYTHIGPVIALDPESAKEVALTAFQSCKEKPVIIDALNHKFWIDWLKSLGFQEQRDRKSVV